uniref:Uncharacterized protein n=1 Tax=Solanum tuberosum TaxID=4113 RepID=M1D998_SOLTU
MYMATRSETLTLKGKVTLESIVEAIVDVSWRIANMKKRMASVEGRLSGMEERSNIPSNRVPQPQPNPVVYPSPCKDSYAGTSVKSGGTRVPSQEPTTKGVTDAFVGCSNIQGKKDPSCGRQSTIANLNTFTIANEQSVNVSLSLSEPIDSLHYIDNVLVENVDTLVDPIDDRIDSSSKIDLCPPSVDTCALKDSTLFDDNRVDQPAYDEITHSDVPSGVNLESSIVLDSYTCYSNPLWCEAFPPKDENIFLEDESTLVGKEGDEEEGGVCFPITSSSWCVSLLNGMTNTFEPTRSHTHVDTLEEVDLRDTFLYYLFTYNEAHDIEWSVLFEGKSVNMVNGCALDPSTWLAFPFDPSSVLNCNLCAGVFGRNGKHLGVDIVDSFPYAGKLFLGFCHPLEEPTLCVGKDSFLDPFSISYPKHDLVECASHGGRRYLPREGVGVSSFEWCSLVVEKNDHCPGSPLVGFIAMTIEDIWLFLVFESPRSIILSVNLCTTPHAKRISFLLMIYMVLQGLDSRTQSYLLAYGDTHTCVGMLSYVSSGINRANESLLDSMLCNPFPFDPGVNFKCAECGSNTICPLHDSSLVLLLDPMCLNEVCLPIWVGNTNVLEPTHELGIITFLKFSSALDGVLIWINTTSAFALRYESVHVILEHKGGLVLV